MLEARASSLGRFIIRVLLWLPACFAVWYFASGVLTIPLRWLVSGLMRLGFNDLVVAVGQSGDVLNFVTNLRPELATTQHAASGVIEIEVSTLTYTYGLPLLVALMLAVPGVGRARKLGIGYIALLPAHVWSVAADALKQMAITLGPGIASQTGFAPLQREAIAYAYQLGTLILPTVVPVVIWLLLQRQFVQGLLEAPRRAPSA
jgi:hypothetical protein